MPDVRSPNYEEFIQKVRSYRTSDVLRGLASLPAEVHGPDADPQLWRRLSPWGIAAIAREALLYGNEFRTPKELTHDDVLRLHNVFGAAHDGSGREHGDPHWLLGVITRHGHEQFMYQESDFEEVARTTAIFRDAALITSIGQELRTRLEAALGASIDDAVGAGAAIYATVVSNGGRWSDDLMQHPEIQPLLRVVPVDVILETRRRMTTDQGGFRQAFAEVGQPSRNELKRWGYNPLVAKPLIELPSGEIVAPQPRLILRRVTPAGLYYDGLQLVGNDFPNLLGPVIESYVGQQLGLVEGAEVVPEFVWGKPERKSIDWFLILPDCVVLVEVKSTRPTIGARSGDVDLVDRLVKSLNRAREQINENVEFIRNGEPAFSAIPRDRPMIGITVTAEPFYTGNSQWLANHLTPTVIPALVASLRDLEGLVPRDASVLGKALLAIANDPELSTWPLASSFPQRLEHVQNPILEAAGSGVPIFKWGDDAIGAQDK